MDLTKSYSENIPSLYHLTLQLGNLVNNNNNNQPLPKGKKREINEKTKNQLTKKKKSNSKIFQTIL
jgi:hypothetical protein